MEDRRNVGESSCNFGDGTDQRVQFLMFMMVMMMMIYFVAIDRYVALLLLTQYVQNSNMLGSVVDSTPSGSCDPVFK